jgi:Flp pilus assembly protein TadG
MRFRPTTDRERRGTSAVELAVVAPFLVYMVCIAVDFARAYRHSQVVTSAARNGALYGCDTPAKAADTAGITQAALSEATDLNPPPTVTIQQGVDAANNPYIQVTVSCQFQTITRFPGVPTNVTVSRTCQMRVCPLKPIGGT